MRLEQLLLHAFGKFQGTELHLSPGLNVIYGPNEAGKSTVQRFIQGMLYGFWKPGARRRTSTEEMEQYAPWEGTAYRGVLTYRLDSTGRRVRVERSFGPNSRIMVTDADTGTILNFAQDERKELLFAREHTGLSESEFMRTACVGQQQTRVIGDADLVNRLNNLRNTGQEDLSVQRVLDRLEARRQNVMHRLRPGKEALDHLDQELTRLARDREEALAGAGRLRELEQELEQTQAVQAAEQLRQETAMLSSAEAAMAEFERLETRLAELAPYAAFPLELQAEVSQLAGKIDALMDEVTQARAENTEAARRHTAAMAALAPWAACQLLPPDTATQAGILLTRWRDAHRERARKRSPLGARRAELADLEARLATARSAGDLRAVQEQLSALDQTLAAAGVREPAEWCARLRQALARARRRAVMATPLFMLSAVSGVAAGGLGLFVHPTFWALLLAAAGLLVLAIRSAAARIQTEALERDLGIAEQANRTWEEIQKKLQVHTRDEGHEQLRAWTRLAEDAEHRRRNLAADDAEVALHTQRANDAELALGLLADPVRALLPSEAGVEATVQALVSLLQSYEQAEQSVREAAAGAQAAARRLDRLERDLTAVAQAEAELLARAGAPDRAGFSAGCAASQEWRSASVRMEHVTRELIRYLGEEGRAGWAAALATARTRVEAAATADTPVTVSGVAADLPELTERTRRLEREAARLRGHLERAFAGTAALAELEIQATGARLAVQELEEEKAALELAKEQIKQAAEAMHREFAPQLNTQLAKVLPQLTNGRYSGAAVDEKLSVQVDVPGTGRRVAGDYLSAGTRDQLYLALRIALLELLVPTGKETPPLLLDDPFVQCDEERLAGCMQLLAQLAQNYQIVLFTCHRRELEFARACGQLHTILLPVTERTR